MTDNNLVLWHQILLTKKDEQIERLRAENKALRKDAERYRWLANDCDGDAQDDFIMWLRWNVCGRLEFDAAIDAAMKGKL